MLSVVRKHIVARMLTVALEAISLAWLERSCKEVTGVNLSTTDLSTLAELSKLYAHDNRAGRLLQPRERGIYL